ncbi:4-hydroxy-tetrahydrodipicolinate synthase [Corynebacterium sp.]|uniref:4-hydroxy-tetrahydrodipicolinate synthase n=1 Tax=Corynebacterium sp. TaxID=1720 RepID=UPI0026DD4A19|nr:4-hydroxy-tetrahydrodipicolinate synthase [Corynebacterium sp.]MDO5076686.1 4-hydroxy-tetrahydrodipicolinate synthase [Corynebacterium sp.]
MNKRPFGRILTAMITPFDEFGRLDLVGTEALARYLVDDLGCDGLVVNGTTGEAPTTTDEEKKQVIATVVAAIGDRAHVLAGASTNDTTHSVALARDAEKAGANGLMLVSPYYSLPPQEGIVQHFSTIAQATDLPVMLYDIPARSTVHIEFETYRQLASIPNVVAVKDATGDIAAMHPVRVETELAMYCGVDAISLPAFASGYAGVVSVIAHLFADSLNVMFDAVEDGRMRDAQSHYDALIPAVSALQGPVQGVIAVKAALDALGLPAGSPRLPLTSATKVQVAEIVAAITAAKQGSNR